MTVGAAAAEAITTGSAGAAKRGGRVGATEVAGPVLLVPLPLPLLPTPRLQT